MTVTLDINVFLDVFQNRQPHYAASAHVVTMAETGALSGVCPAHGLTTIYYLVRRLSTKHDAEAAIDRILDHFEIGNLDMAGWREARSSPFDDFEDAAVAATAKAAGSDFIVTRDVGGFSGSPIPVMSPEELLIKLRTEP